MKFIVEHVRPSLFHKDRRPHVFRDEFAHAVKAVDYRRYLESPEGKDPRWPILSVRIIPVKG